MKGIFEVKPYSKKKPTFFQWVGIKIGQLFRLIGFFVFCYFVFTVWKWNASQPEVQQSRSISVIKYEQKLEQEREFQNYVNSFIAGQDILDAGVEKAKSGVRFPSSFQIPFLGDKYENIGNNRWKVSIRFSATNNDGLKQRGKAVGVASINKDYSIKWHSFSYE